MAMRSRSCLLSLLLSLSLLTYDGVHAGRTLSKEEDLELENLLRIHEKPKPVRTIKTQAGDIYNCIKIKEQPALDHHLFKNHIVQIPTTTSSQYRQLSEIMITVDCPEGTVPIRKLSKEDLIRIRSFSKSYAPKIHPQTSQEPGKHYAILRSKNNEKRFYGVHSIFKVQNLTIRNNQASSSEMWIENDTNGQVNSLQAGWMVSPELYKDSLTRLFGFWDVKLNGVHSRGCYNTICVPGFIQVDKNHPIDAVLRPHDNYNSLWIRIIKDKDTGHWWLQFNLDFNNMDSDNWNPIGYWAKDMVPNLSEGSSYYAWGGFANGPAGGPAAPLGTGLPFESQDPESRCYVRSLKLYDNSYLKIDPFPIDMEVYVDNRNCYGAYYGGIDPEGVSTFQFGGQGGDCGP